MQFLRLNETCRMIGYSLLNISYKIHYFLEKKNFGGTRHPCEKNEPILDHSGGWGVNGKACWLIAYKQTAIYFVCTHPYVCVCVRPILQCFNKITYIKSITIG